MKDKEMQLPSGNNKELSSNISNTDKTRKLPTFLTGQVLVGYLNDIFSSCVFRSVPNTGKSPVQLSRDNKNRTQYYMLVVKWSKNNILLQTLSYGFSIKSSNSKNKNDGISLAIGLVSGLRKHSETHTDTSRISLNSFKGFIPANINKGGLWAYECAPPLLIDNITSEVKDSDILKSQEKRRDKILEIAKKGLHIIDSSVILSLLWSFYHMNIYIEFQNVCKILINEFIEYHYENTQYLVYALFFCSKMDIVSEEILKKMLNTSLNNITVLETLTLDDIVIILNTIKPESRIFLSSLISKIIVVINDYINDMDLYTSIYLLFGFTEMQFDFMVNYDITARILNRIVRVFDKLQVQTDPMIIFNTIMKMPFDTIPYFNRFIDKIISKLHLLDHKMMIEIGCAYAIAHNNVRLMDDLNNLEYDDPILLHNRILGIYDKPLSNHIYDCLEFVARTEMNKYRPKCTELLMIMYDTLLYNSTDKLYDDMLFDKNSLLRYSKRTKLSTSQKTMSNRDDESIDMNELAYSNSYKLFYLNVLEDCCNTFDELEPIFIEHVTFSLMTLNIDIEPLYQVVLMHKGEARKRNSHIHLNILREDSTKFKRQYEMAREILQYTRNRNDPNKELLIEGLIPECHIKVTNNGVEEQTHTDILNDMEPTIICHDVKGDIDTNETEHKNDEDCDRTRSNKIRENLDTEKILCMIANCSQIDELIKIREHISESMPAAGDSIHEIIQLMISSKINSINECNTPSDIAINDVVVKDTNNRRTHPTTDTHTVPVEKIPTIEKHKVEPEYTESELNNFDKGTSGPVKSKLLKDKSTNLCRKDTNPKILGKFINEIHSKQDNAENRSTPAYHECSNQLHKHFRTGSYKCTVTYRIKQTVKYKVKLVEQMTKICYNYSKVKGRFE